MHVTVAVHAAEPGLGAQRALGFAWGVVAHGYLTHCAREGAEALLCQPLEPAVHVSALEPLRPIVAATTGWALPLHPARVDYCGLTSVAPVPRHSNCAHCQHQEREQYQHPDVQ